MTNPKQIVGEKATEFIENGMTVGLGTGSTAYFTTRKVGQLIQNGLNIRCVPTSKSTEQLAYKWNIPLVPISEVEKIDITIDGADEVDPDKNLIKGGGGAHLREKIVASITGYYIIIVDNSKLVHHLGKFKLPVEITPFAREVTRRQVNQLGCTSDWRKKEDGSDFISDNDNFILDCSFELIKDPRALNLTLNQIPGVVENGLFVGMADKIISSDSEGNLKIY
ncbi:ribose-5-phosphate isomerase RpiA [Membranihabitans maritimus]|uniref:ribose-5-phosphate isomerase RpiA n=1 Tax=Membranihabitans maritimus TaxID=2904244 RepID=UPI001F011C76|nr:ribose-5-phosphate isomerase RpiA [Membranihabitans maritimus]